MRTCRFAVLTAALVIPFSSVARAQAVSPKPAATATPKPTATATPPAATVKVPQTADDHLALAKRYDEQAATHRALAEEHRTMAAEYKKSLPPPGKAGQPNPWAKKMDAHCMAIVKDAEKLAADAEKMAEFHRLRAKELQGK